MLSIRPSLKIVATLLVKNEEDIVGKTLEHHISQGVTTFIVTDNNSTDSTRSILARYPEVVELIEEKEDNHNQSKWVTQMARLACKFSPDWIIHLDADELWCNLYNFREIRAEAAACECLYLHPPTEEEFHLDNMRYYLDIDHLPIPQECKIAHRPNPQVVITHGNHDALGVSSRISTKWINRHHFPIRSYLQWERKTVHGHLALKKRDVTCKRWENWYNIWLQGKLPETYSSITENWKRLITNPTDRVSLESIMKIWVTEDMEKWFQSNTEMIPKIKEWSI